MFKQILILVMLTIGLTTALYYKDKTTDKDYLMKQKSIYNLLFHVGQPNITHNLYNEGKQYDIKANIASYSNKEAVENFLHMYEHGFLPQGEICSVYYKRHAYQILALVKVFYYAHNFDTFYKTALWARSNVNTCIFIMALYTAVTRRPDTMYIQLPHPYEMYPYVFFNSEVMEKAHHAKVFGQFNAETNTYVIPANYSGWYLTREHDHEHKLNYFVEDVGLNSYYFFLKLDNPFFLNSSQFGRSGEYRGEEYLYAHKQIFARYILERLSNGMDKVEDFDWHEPFHTGYYPTMTFHSGLPFPQRPHWSRFPYFKYKSIRDIEEYESRILSAIDSGSIFCRGERIKLYEKADGINYLGNLMEGNSDSCNRNFYGSLDILSRKILGFNLNTYNDYQINPSALEIWSTSLRDPAFYRILKRYVDYYIRYNSHLTPYKQSELIFPKYKIESVSIDKLQTYFDSFESTISNGLIVDSLKEAESLIVNVKQWRLNHKPFNIHMGINAEEAGKVNIKIFLGPKYDSHHKLLNFFDVYKYYYEIDNFITTLNPGMNKVERSSHDFVFLISDQDSAHDYYKKVLKALESGEKFNYKQRLFGFPERLLLPKGKREGLPLQLFVYVSPVAQEFTYKSRVFGDGVFDSKNAGFPLDRSLNEAEFHGPNMFFREVIVYHKDELEINMTH